MTKRTLDVVLPDSGPLISLARGGHLDLLLRFKSEVRIIVADLVKHEVTRFPDKYEDSAALSRFFRENAARIEIAETELGQFIIAQMKSRDAYENAPAETKAVMETTGAVPPKPPRNRGEAVILTVARDIGRAHPDDVMLIFAEDRYFLSESRFAERHTHILSTRAFLEGLARKNIISFDAVWADIVAKRPNAVAQSVDRGAPDIETDWESAIDEGR